MEHIATISFDFPQETAKSNRNAFLKEIYSLYVSQPEKTQWENRKRYHEYVRVHHKEVCRKVGFSKESYDQYKSEFKKAKLPKDKQFIKYIPEDSLWYLFSHIPTEDLGFITSRARDIGNRGGNIASFIVGSVIHK